MKLSINTRTVIGAGLVLSVFLILTGWTLDRAFEDSARTAIQERLRGQLYLVIGETDVSETGKIGLPVESTLARLNQPDSGLYASVYLDNKSVWQSQSLIATQPPFISQLKPGEERFELLSAENSFVLGYGIEWQTATENILLTFSIIEDTRSFRAQINQYRKTLWGWLGGMAILLLLAQLLVLRWGLRPLRTVANELMHIEQGQQEQLRADYPAELRGLTDNLNTLLSHERAQQQRYRHALDDLAHSLKTPLAVLQGAIDEPNTIREQVGRIQQSIDYQLQRAATAGRSGLNAPIPLKPVIDSLVSALQKVYRDKQLQFNLSVDTNLLIRADKGDLTELCGNLLDNACKWGQQVIKIDAKQIGDALNINIHDDGSGIPADQLEHILQRGGRADEAVTGQGIGLAVVQEIVNAYAGRLTLSNHDDGGLLVSITIPNRQA